MRRAALISVLCVLVASIPASALASPRDTTVRTIVDRDGDNLLEYGPGQDYVVVGTTTDEDGDTDTVEPDDQSFRPPRQGSILYFLQLSDFQIIDEESPGRVEFLDKTQRGLFNPFSAAYRPQDSLTTQITEAMVRAARNTTSSITSEQLDLTILTGDNADSQQFNETRWFIDILDGTTGERDASDLPSEVDGANTSGFTFVDKIDPNSGYEGVCDNSPGSLYDGVKNGGDLGYYDPDVSVPDANPAPDTPTGDGQGYSPNRLENIEETGRDVTVRDFPGLFEAAQKPFEAIGLDMPWYSAFGNHDALVQGNSPEAFFGPLGTSGEALNPTFDAIVRGCFKPKESFLSSTLDEDAPLPGLLEFLQSAPSSQQVPPDERRCYLAKDEAGTLTGPPCSTGGWIQQHFLSSGAPVGHGFAPAPCPVNEPPEEELEDDPNDPLDEVCFGYGRPPQADANNDGYYSFAPRQGLRFVVIDTITDECGAPICAEGSVDDTQFDWLRQQLELATAAGEYAMVFSHHTLRTTRFVSSDPSEYEDVDGVDEEPEPPGIHYGLRIEHEDDQPQPQPVNPTSPARTLEELFCEYPNMIAHVAGHEHENYVKNYDCDGNPEPSAAGPSGAFGGFWHISTAAHLDWPQQSRTIELIDNHDETADDPGTMSLALTILDHDGPPNPGGPPPDYKPGGQSGEQVLKLASIGREIAYNDYQGSRTANGEPSDRNVIIELDRPWPYVEDEPGN